MISLPGAHLPRPAVGGGPSYHGGPIVEVRPETRSGTGARGAASVDATVQAHLAELNPCSRTATLQSGGADGRIDVLWTIDERGVVTEARPSSITLLDMGVMECFLRVTRGWRFAPAAGGATVVRERFTLLDAAGVRRAPAALPVATIRPADGGAPASTAQHPVLSPNEVFDQAGAALVQQSVGACRANPNESVFPFFTGNGTARVVTFTNASGQIELIESCGADGGRGQTVAIQFYPQAAPGMRYRVTYIEGGMTAEWVPVGRVRGETLCSNRVCRVAAEPASAERWSREWDFATLGRRAGALDRAVQAARH